MNRFSSLEFEDSGGKSSRKTTGEPIRDAMYFYQEALRGYLHGDFEAALRNFSRALERNNTFFEAWAGQIRMLIELGEYPEALVWADKALESFPDHPELIAAKASACLRDAKMDKAIGLSDFSLSKENAGPWVWLARAEVLMQRKSRIAEECLRKALHQAGQTADLIRFEAGRIFARYEHYSAARELLSETVRVFPKSALAWYELGRCLARLGFGEAEVSLKQALHLRPNWRPAQAELDRLNRTGPLKKAWRRFFVR